MHVLDMGGNLYSVMNMHEMLSYKTILKTHDCILLFNNLVQSCDEIVYNDLGHAFTAPLPLFVSSK